MQDRDNDNFHSGPRGRPPKSPVDLIGEVAATVEAPPTPGWPDAKTFWFYADQVTELYIEFNRATKIRDFYETGLAGARLIRAVLALMIRFGIDVPRAWKDAKL